MEDLSLRPPNLQPTQVSSAPSLPPPIDSSWSAHLSSWGLRSAGCPSSDRPWSFSLCVGLMREFLPLGLVSRFWFCMWIRYYCFEWASRPLHLCWRITEIVFLFKRFVWISRGYSLSRRIRYLEERWAYFFSFGQYHSSESMGMHSWHTTPSGLPATALCMWGSTLANVALFALFFPAVSIYPLIPHQPFSYSF